MNGPTPPPVNLVPGQQPTRAQIEAIQEHMRMDAERMGITMDQYIAKLKEAHAQQVEAQQRQQQAQQGGHQHGPNCNHDHDHEHQHGPPAQHQPVQSTSSAWPTEARGISACCVPQESKPQVEDVYIPRKAQGYVQR
jgi:translocation protein SEC62